MTLKENQRNIGQKNALQEGLRQEITDMEDSNIKIENSDKNDLTGMDPQKKTRIVWKVGDTAIGRIAKCIGFVLVFLLCLNQASDILARKSLAEPWNMSVKIGGFYNEPRNSIDVMYFGSSHMYCSIDPLLVEEETGLTSYILATQKQPLWISYYYMREALKYQDLKIIVLEVNMLNQKEEFAEEDALYSAFDPMPFSKNKVEAVYASVPDGSRRHYLFNIMKYHVRWEELELIDITREYREETDIYRGYVRLGTANPVEEREDISEVVGVGSPLPKSMEYLQKIVDLCKDNGIELIFLKSPSNATAEEQLLINVAWEVAEKEGIVYLDGNRLYEELELNLEWDFHDRSHLNFLGAEKLTRYFVRYLK